MSKNAIIFHGTRETPESYWYPWLASQLRGRGYEVDVPAYPEINETPIAEFITKVMKNHRFDEDTVLVGHSAGGPLLLSILERVHVNIPQAILVAGYSSRLQDELDDPVLQESYDWERIGSHVRDIYFINSVNDPWGCDAEQGRTMFDHLGGTQIIRNDGHFGSGMWDQPYPTFELLDRLIR
jgi:uncharacterized protein